MVSKQARGTSARGGSVRGAALRARLVAGDHAATTTREWPAPAAAVIGTTSRPAGEDAWSPFRVHGGPGTGKTSLIVDAAVARLTDPAVSPESVLVIAANRRAAVTLREEITRRVLASDAGFAGGADEGQAPGRGAVREPLVRTVHSYAFAILRLQASAHSNPPPRLITGSEQDVVLRELLAGDIEDGARYWPPHLRPALATDGFAQALRDLLMRAAERGVGPEDLTALGRHHKRPEWVAAGRAYAQYEQNMLLRGAVGLATPGASAPAVDAAELVGSALSAFATDPDLLAGQRRRIRHLLVDDAQHLDPQAASLLTLIGTGTDSTIIAADTDQSVFGFRGANPSFADGLADSGDPRDVVLTVDHRSHPSINRVGRALVARLPGARPHAYPEPATAETDAAGPATATGARVQVFSSSAKEATAVADLLRRAHLFDGVPWSEMAVIVRSVSLALPALRRAFRSAGVPMSTPTSDLPLHRQRAVIGLMLVLKVIAARDTRRGVWIAADTAGLAHEFGVSETADDVTLDDVMELLTGVIGGGDPGSMRRLRRGVRRLDEKAGVVDVDSLTSLRSALLDTEAAQRYLRGLSESEAKPLRRALSVVDAAYRVHSANRGLEETLWAAWQETGHDRRWAASALRGGPLGEQADRDLDAVIAMFEAAGTFVDNLPAAGPSGFVHYLTQLQIPRDSRAAGAAADSVTVLSAHAATGREWEVVAVAGVLDGLWPSLKSRGSVLSTGQLVDLLDGMSAAAVDTVARGSVAVADERRLFLVACTRARSSLLVTAVEDGVGDASPSRFIGEIASATGEYDDLDGQSDEYGETLDELPLHPGVGRVLSLPSMVATLRAALVDGAAEAGSGAAGEPGAGDAGVLPARAQVAAELLAELADADVAGAHPRDWYGLVGASTDVALWDSGRGPVPLSPSNVESLSKCSLRWMLERNGGRDGDAAPAITGTLVHTLVQAVAGNIDPDDVADALREIWDRVDNGVAWYSARELERTEGMLSNFRDWLRVSRAELTEYAVETDVDATVPPAPDDDLAVRLRGRIDRLETDAQGRPVVVDVKTGKSPITAKDAADHAQLAAYQVAIALGGITGFGVTEPGGGRLVFVSSVNKKTGAAQRTQDPPTPEKLEEWTALVRTAARASVGPTYTATPNSGCVTCSLVTSCPAQLRGKSVIDD